MSAAADKRGLKRVCVDCGIRFYDMNKRPIVCPNCSTEFTGVIKVKTRRGRVAKALEEDTESQVIESKAKKKAVNDDDDEIEEIDDVEVVSLDDEDVERDDNDVDGDDDITIDLDDDEDLGDLDEDLDDEDLGDLEDLEEDGDAEEEEEEEEDKE